MTDYHESKDTQEHDAPLDSGHEELSPLGIASVRGTEDAYPETLTAPSDTHQIEEGANQLSQINEITHESWRDLEQAERLQTMQRVEDTMADIQRRPACGVVSEPMKPGSNGYFDGQEIHISSQDLDTDDVVLNVDNVIHEGRHAYQHYAIDNPGFHSNQAQVEAWRENSQDYIDPEYDPEAYRYQAMEVDAWDYASAITSNIYSQS